MKDCGATEVPLPTNHMLHDMTVVVVVCSYILHTVCVYFFLSQWTLSRWSLFSCCENQVFQILFLKSWDVCVTFINPVTVQNQHWPGYLRYMISWSWKLASLQSLKKKPQPELTSISLINTLGLFPSPNLKWHTKILAHSGFSGHLRSIAILRSILSFQRYRGLHAFISSCLNSCSALFVRLPPKRERLQCGESAEARLSPRTKRRDKYHPLLTDGFADFCSDYVQMFSWPGSTLSPWTFDCLTDHRLHDWPNCDCVCAQD